MRTKAKISAVRAISFVVVEQFTTFSQFRCHCLLLYQNLRAPAWESKPLPHLNLCTGKDLRLVPSGYPIASETLHSSPHATQLPFFETMNGVIVRAIHKEVQGTACEGTFDNIWWKLSPSIQNPLQYSSSWRGSQISRGSFFINSICSQPFIVLVCARVWLKGLISADVFSAASRYNYTINFLRFQWFNDAIFHVRSFSDRTVTLTVKELLEAEAGNKLCAQVAGKWKRKVGLAVPVKFMALTSELCIARILERELTTRAEKYSCFELKNIKFKENKLPMLL